MQTVRMAELRIMRSVHALRTKNAIIIIIIIIIIIVYFDYWVYMRIS